MSNSVISRLIFGLLSPMLPMLLIGQLSAPAYAQTQPQVLPAPAPRRVLLLYTYGDGLPAYQKATPAFLSVMAAGGIDINDLFFEYLDLQRNNNAEYRQKLADLLRYKYAKHQVGLIVTVHTAALNFLLDEAKGLFPDAPIFSYLLVRPELIEAKNRGRRILLRPQSQDMAGTLEIALKMFPQTRKIVFVTGTASGDRNLEQEARRAFEPWRDKLEFQYTNDRSVEEILQLVASLPPRSIVIYNNVFSDKTDRTFIPREVGKMVAKAANAPVFCLWDTLIGSGVIGGSLLSFEAEGTYAASVVLDMLNGKMLLSKPVTTLPTSKTYMFDAQQLKRWGVNESILPKGSVLVNRVPTLWQQHKELVILGIAAFLAQTMLVIGLLVQRRRRRSAEESLKEQLGFERLLSDISAKFLNIPPSEIDREIEGALKRIVDFFRVSHCVLMKGFREEHRALITHAAHAEDIPPTPLGGNLYSFFPWTAEMLAQGEIIWIPTLDRLPAEAAADKETYRNLGVRSVLIIPIFIENLPGYAISISLHQEAGVWPQDYIPRLQLLGEILVNALERKRTEESLREKTEELDQFFNVTLDLLCIANTDGYFLRLNPAWERILGYTREELTAKRFLEFVHPDDLDRTREAVSTLSSQQEVVSFENRYRCKDGTYRWLEWSSSPAGKLIYAAARDITERKWNEEEAVQHVKNMECLSETAMGFVELPAEKDIYWFIGEKLRQLTGDAIYVSVNAYDQKTRKIEGRALLADDQHIEAILKTLGTDVRGMSFTLSEEAWDGLISGELVRVPGGIYELFLGESPKASCDALEKLVGIGDIFAMGFASKGDLYGNAIIIMPEGSQLSNRDVIETFLRQAGVTLQRKLAEEALKKSEERYRMLVETMTEGLGVQDENGLWTYVNDRLCEMLGRFHGEIIGHPVTEFLDEANQSILKEQMEMRRDGNSSPFEITWTRADGKKMTTLVSPKPIFDSGGQFRGSFAVTTDMTERKQMQDKIRNAAEEWQTTFDSIQDLVIILDPEFKLVRVNAATLSFFNLPLERVLGKHCYDLMHGTSEPVRTCPLAKMLKTKTHEETELYDDKTDAWLHVSVDPVFDDKGQIIRVIHTVKDVTESKQAESEAFRARRELLRMERLSRMGELTASLAHELNQPLTAILSNAQAALRFLQRENPDLNELRDILQDISSDDKRAGSVIRSLRAMMKQEEREREPLSINELVREVVSLFHSEAVLRNVIIDMEFTESLPTVLADKIQLQQVVLNLMMNATEAMDHEAPESRKLFLKTRRADHGAIEVAVRDRGPGIEEEKLDRVFQPFFTTKGAGLGMGLSISRSIIEAHGGRLWAENNRDKGATFFFEIPVVGNQ